MFTVNPNPSYKPEPYAGTGWKEIAGATALPFLRQPTWTKDGVCDVLQNREIDADGSGGLNDSTLPAMLYKGTVRDRTIGVVIGNIQSPLRAFMVADEAAYQSLVKQLQTNKGFVDEQMKAVGKVFTGNDASSLYAWQGSFFGYSNHLHKVAKTSAVSRTKSKTFLKDSKARILDEKETVNLIKDICKRYNVYNVKVTLGKFNGSVLGWCKTSDDQVTPFARPVGIEMWLASDLLYMATTIHECAHAIEFFKTGVSGHGKGFRDIFRLLLKQYMEIDPVGL